MFDLDLYAVGVRSIDLGEGSLCIIDGFFGLIKGKFPREEVIS